MSEDIRIHAEEIVRLRRRQEELLAEHTGQPIERIVHDLDRDFILGAEEAMAYGVVDHVDRPPQRRLRSMGRAEAGMTSM